ncbi:ATP-binding protein [Desulfurivibrio sp. C05AmB]|uniref:ATP-binding protein n=1 Tax=Desulfurivibrio sp. C05AmB TaxID=3374371 RepID=UPI00376EB119
MTATKNKFIILGIFFLLVSLLVTMNVIFHESLRLELAALYNNQQVLVAKGIANSLEVVIEREISKLRVIGNFLTVDDHLEDPVVKSLVDNYFQVAETIKGFTTIYNANDQVVYSTPGALGRTRSPPAIPPGNNTDFFITHSMERLFIYLPLRRGIRHKGWLLSELPISDLATRFLTPFKSMEKGYAWLMDGEGNLLYHPTEPHMIANNLYRAGVECFQCHNSFEIEHKVLDNPELESGRYLAPTKEDKVLAFSRLKMGDNTWIISVSSPYTEVISVTERSMRIYSWLVAAIFFTVLLGASALVLMQKKRTTAAQQASTAIRLEKQKLDTIVSAIGCGLLLQDRGHKIIWINHTLRQWTGDVVGQDCQAIFSDYCPPAAAGQVSHQIIKGLFGRKNNIFQITSAPVRDQEGEISGELKLIQDITELKRLEEKLVHSEKLSALGRVAAGVAHEIINPLTSISSLAQIVQQKSQEEATRGRLATILEHIGRISKIVGQMSQFSKLPNLRISRHDLRPIVEAAVEITRFDRKMAGITIHNEVADDLPPVEIDPDYLLQVFINLLLNAADACGEQGTITLRSRSENNLVLVEVGDTGCGIDENDLARVFDPFFTTKEKGTGLGLPISYEILKKLGGDLRLSSHPNTGSVFTVILPGGGTQ